MRLLVSACLLGIGCRYDGSGKPCTDVLRLGEKHSLVPVCPEILGGLPTPRCPAERQGDRVITRQGEDVTEAYRRGAREAVRIGEICRCQAAVLKERSPSCGSGLVYDGSFCGRLTEGDGVFAALCRQRGLPLYGESEIGKLL